MNRILFIFLSIQLIAINNGYSQCPLVAAACGGSEMASSGAVTIPSGTTYKISAGNTSSALVTFTDATSILCIEGTWTGKPASATAAGVINVYGLVNYAGSWSFNGGTGVINVFRGASFRVSANFSVSGGTYTIINCGEEFKVGATLSITGGTVVIDNYGSFNITTSITNNNSGLTLTNKSGSLMYLGGSVSWSAGTFISNGDLCVTGSVAFSGGSFTNGNCLRTSSLTISGTNAFTNNYSIYVSGAFSNSGSGSINNGNMTITAGATNSGTMTNNGTMSVTDDFSNTGTFTYGAGSLLTCTGWSSNGTNNGPGSGCAQIRATGATSFSGNFDAANSGRVHFYDSGAPGANGFDTYSGTKNSLNVNSNACTPTVYPTCANATTACAAALPIELMEFKTDCKNGSMELFWITATETNNDFFTVERIKDGTAYDIVGIVDSKAPGGNSIQTLTYSFKDNSFPKEQLASLNSIFYYRLKQTDFDGNYTYSDVQPASCSGNCITGIRVVSDNGIKINVSAVCSATIDLSIYNTLGQIVSDQKAYVESGDNLIVLNAHNLASSLYILRASTKNQKFLEKFVK